MNRRGFLRFLSAAAATAVLVDPEQLLWVPGRKKFFIPPPVAVPSLLDQINMVTLRQMQRAMAAGIADRVWSVRDLLEAA